MLIELRKDAMLVKTFDVTEDITMASEMVRVTTAADLERMMLYVLRLTVKNKKLNYILNVRTKSKNSKLILEKRLFLGGC
jgi:hypothetical protein